MRIRAKQSMEKFSAPELRAEVIYEVEFANQKHIRIGFFALHYAKLCILELHCNFFEKFCDVDNFEEFDGFDFFFLTLVQEDSYDCIRRAKEKE